MVKKTMQSREFGSIQTERLRNELRTAVNGVLGKTEVADLEFRDFRIEEVRK